MKKEKYHNQREQFEMKCELNVNGSWVKFFMKENDKPDPDMDERMDFHDALGRGEYPEGPPTGPVMDQMWSDGLMVNKMIAFDTESIARMFVEQRVDDFEKDENGEDISKSPDGTMDVDAHQRFWSAFMMNFAEMINQMFHKGCEEYHDYWSDIRKRVTTLKKREEENEDISE